MTAPYRIAKERGWWYVYRAGVSKELCRASSWRYALEWLAKRYARSLKECR